MSTLQARSVSVWGLQHWDETSVQADIPGTDMVVAIGGDGAMLRAARACAPHKVPVLGINMGHLGFLTEIKDPDTWESHIDDLLADNFWVEERMMIQVQVYREDAVVCAGAALNDIVVSRGNVTQTIRLNVYIDHEWTTTYTADALIISTATGSTAYALAAGGPILPPEMRNILIVPVAPHLSLDRPIVLPEGATVEVVAAGGRERDMVLTADGIHLHEPKHGDRISIQASEDVSRFARLRERNYFYRSLLDRLEPRLPVTVPPPDAQDNRDDPDLDNDRR